MPNLHSQVRIMDMAILPPTVCLWPPKFPGLLHRLLSIHKWLLNLKALPYQLLSLTLETFFMAGSAVPVGSPSAPQTTNESGAHSNNNVLGGFFSLPGSYTSMAQQTAPPLSTAAPVIVPNSQRINFSPSQLFGLIH